MLEHLFGSEGIWVADESWMESLNEAQRRAVTHGGGPLLVVAGAGTGKTMTVACRVAHLIQRGVRPERILLLTFSRRAAREMLGRAANLTSREAARVRGGTFHAVANRLLRTHGRPLGVSPDFTVLDRSDTADVLGLVRGDLGYANRERRFPRGDTLAAIYSRTVNAGERLEALLRAHFPWCAEEAEGIREIFAAYLQRKREQNVLDYDDLLVYWRALATSEDDPVRRRFDHVLVDEYQDTNALQADILAGLHREIANITVVGDDAQAIYSFRAATVRNIMEFPQRFPGATVVKLETNYRSTQPILDASNAVIALAPRRHHKTLRATRRGDRRPLLLTCRDEAFQCDEVCRRALEHREQGVPLRHQAVLFRTGHHSDQLEIELTRRNIPFVKYGGLKFMEAAHVKDVVACLRVLENPRDEVSWFRVLLLLEGVGPGTARRTMMEIGLGPHAATTGAASPLTSFLERSPKFPAAAGGDAERLKAALVDCTQALMGPASEIERLRAFLEPVFARRYEAAAARLRDVEQLEALASRHGTRGAFLTDLTLDPPSSTEDLAGPPLLDEDYLILSTIHSAKGGEWDVVHVIHAADGMIPSDMATGDDESIEEERRLLYVALTRARDALYVYFPLRYYRRPRGNDDVHGYAQLTRFLARSVRSHFDQAGPAGEEPDAGADEGEAGSRGPTERPDDYLAGLFSG